MSRDVLAFSRRSFFVYMTARFYNSERERERSDTVVEKRSVLICGDLLWISISVTSG